MPEICVCFASSREAAKALSSLCGRAASFTWEGEGVLRVKPLPEWEFLVRARLSQSGIIFDFFT